eukprot:COSAG06_NODE_31956_length_513_cov_1.287440_2_plen_54_part_01
MTYHSTNITGTASRLQHSHATRSFQRLHRGPLHRERGTYKIPAYVSVASFLVFD